MSLNNLSSSVSKSKITICVIILNYLGYKNTIDCVTGLLEQKLSRIVILENSGSIEEETQIKRAFNHVSNIQIISSQTNLGFSGGVNYVLTQISPLQFDAFLILNNDVLAPPSVIETLIKGAQTKSLDLAAPLIYGYPKKHLIWSQGNFYNSLLGLVTPRPIQWLPANLFYLTGCCLLVRRSVFDAVGFFDETFFMYGEDIDFCYRAQQKGFRLGIVKEAHIYHRINSSTRKNSLFYEYHVNRGHFFLSRKLSRSDFEYVVSLSTKILVLAIRAFLRSLRYHNLTALRGYILAIPFTKNIWGSLRQP